MKRLSTYTILLLIVVSACDTENNLKLKKTFLKYFGVQGNQVAMDMAVASDGFVYLLGNHVTTNFDAENYKPYIIKVDERGESVWEQTVEGLGNAKAKDIEIAADGSLLIVGDSELSGERDFFILVINSSDGGEIRRVIDGYPSFTENVESITQISDGYIVSGSTTNAVNAGDQRDGFFFRYLNDFSPYGIVWTNRYGPGAIDVTVKTIEAKPGIFYMFGYSNQLDILDQTNDYNFWVFKTNDVGTAGSLKFTPGQARTNEVLTSVVPIPGTTNFLLTGTTEDGGVSELYAMKVRGDLETIENVDDLVQQEKTLTNFGLSTNAATKAVGYSSLNGEYFMVSSQNSDGNEDIYFSRLDNRLIAEPESEGLRFGGVGNDTAASVMELPDGFVLILGTMVLGEFNGQKKVVLMRVNSRGKFE